MDTDFFTLMKRLKQNMPLTSEKLSTIGFQFGKPYTEVSAKNINAKAVQLNDGATLYYIRLTCEDDGTPEGTIFVFSIMNKRITRDEIRSRLDTSGPDVLPADNPPSKFPGYHIYVGKFRILAYYAHEENEDILGSMCFVSTDKSP